MRIKSTPYPLCKTGSANCLLQGWQLSWSGVLHGWRTIFAQLAPTLCFQPPKTSTACVQKQCSKMVKGQLATSFPCYIISLQRSQLISIITDASRAARELLMLLLLLFSLHTHLLTQHAIARDAGGRCDKMASTTSVGKERRVAGGESCSSPSLSLLPALLATLLPLCLRCRLKHACL